MARREIGNSRMEAFPTPRVWMASARYKAAIWGLRTWIIEPSMSLDATSASHLKNRSGSVSKTSPCGVGRLSGTWCIVSKHEILPMLRRLFACSCSPTSWRRPGLS